MTLFLTEAEHEIVKQLVKAEADAVRSEIHQSTWRHHEELKGRLEVVEGLATKLDIGPMAEAG